MDIFGWIGWGLVFILGLLNIWQFWRNRIGLKISFHLHNSLISEIIQDYDRREETNVKIKTDFYNKGKSPVTISEIELLTDYNEDGYLERVEVETNPTELQRFRSIRLEGNDRKSVMLYATIQYFLPLKVNGLQITFIFKTPHKDIEKSFWLSRIYTREQINELKNNKT